MPIVFHLEGLTIDFGEYTFSAEVLQDIIEYIKIGGMPGWLNGHPPDYISRMIAQLTITDHRHLKK